jgi:hypothetical protein
MTQSTDIKAAPLPPPAWKRPVKQAFSQRRIRTGLIVTLAGMVIFLLGARPALFGVDRSPVIGFIQIAVFLVGLALVCLGGYLSLMALWKDRQTSIVADIGLRLVATGYVIAVFAGMADIFGFGSHPLPGIPYFGAWQARGVEIGQAMIALGFLMLIPLHPSKTDSHHNPANN